MKKAKSILAVLLIWLACAGTAGAVEVDVLGGIEIHGFLSQGYLLSDEYNYLSHDSKEGSFHFNEVGINFSKSLTDKLRIGLQLFSRDLGNISNNDITVDWAYADYRWKDYLGVRIGKIKIPRGIFNEIRDIDMLRTCIVLPQGIYPELLRDVFIAIQGFSVYGNVVPFNGFGRISYQGIIGGMDINGENGAEKNTNNTLASAAASISGDYDLDTAYSGALLWETPLKGLMLKATYMATSGEVPYESLAIGNGEIRFQQVSEWILSTQYTWEALTLTAEYRELTQKTKLTSLSLPFSTKIQQAYYVMGSYRLTDQMEVGAYYAWDYPDKDDKNDYTEQQKDLAVTLRYDINEFWVAKLEGHLMDGTAQVLSVDNPSMLEDDWSYLAAKVTFSF